MKKRTNYKKLWQEAVQLNDYIITTGMRRFDTDERTDVVGETLQYYIKGTAKSINGVNASFTYEPHNPSIAVGGDFFDTIPFDNGKVALVVGDMIGKGPLAASKTVALKFALRAFAHDYSDPCDLLRKLNTYICTYDPDVLATVAIAVIDPIRHELVCASAGAEPPLLIRHKGIVEESKARGVMLGAVEDLDCLSWHTSFKPGDILVMFTDGISECHTPGETLFIQEVPRHLRKLRKRPLQDIANGLLHAAKKYVHSMTLNDDACIMVAKLEH